MTTEAPPKVYVCDKLTDDQTVCGEAFSTPSELGRHSAKEHPGQGGKKAQAERERRARRAAERAGETAAAAGSSPDRPPTQPKAKAPSAPTKAPASRAESYAQGIGALALFGYVGHVIDEWESGCIAKGAPAIAAPLAQVAEAHPALRQVCDLILGGGGGGPWAQLAFAVLGVGAPIAAHRGWVPEEVGRRFGQMIGVMDIPVLAPPEPEAPAPEPEAEQPDTPEARAAKLEADLMTLLEQDPATAVALAVKMNGGARPDGAIVVPGGIEPAPAS